MSQLAEREGCSSAATGKLNNVLMQMRKVCNHPDLITAPFTNAIEFPPVDELVRQCGKMQLLDRLLTRLQAGGHKVLIFSQVQQGLLWRLHGGPLQGSHQRSVSCRGA